MSSRKDISQSDTAKDLNQYSIGKYKYPEDVGTSPDLQHSMVFFINVRGNSKSKTADNYAFELVDNMIVNKKGVLVGIVLATGAAVAVPVMGAVSALANSAMTRRFVGHLGPSQSANQITAQKKSNNANIGSVTASGASGAAKALAMGAAVATTAALFSETTLYRLKDAITLAIQEPPKVSYKVNYDKWDAGTLMGGSSAGADKLDMAQAGMMKFAQIPSVIGAPDFGKGMQKMSGQTPNPFKTALFQDVELRHFQYHYKFMPKTKAEADNVRNIIKTFKTHMHPEFATNKVFLIHPSEFNIVYYYKGKENEAFNKISTCVLVEMEVDAGESHLATFEDGMSVEINMKLTFMETEMMTREKIEKGY